MRARGLFRLYWMGCGAAVLIGLAGLAGVLLIPFERFDEEGRLIGEMPPTFGLALLSLVLGLSGALAGLAAALGRWLWRRRPPLG